MKKIIFIVLALYSLVTFSQENEHYKKAASEFMLHYNESNYEAIFNMLDANMKTVLPLDEARTFFDTNVKSTGGQLKSLEFFQVKNQAHIYKATFEHGISGIVLSLDEANKINALYISPLKSNAEIIERNTTKMILPFQEEWTVFWGGTTVEENYHVAYENQKYAYDLVITKEGQTFSGSRDNNANFYAFGKELMAPCDAKVIKVITGIQDNIPGIMNPKHTTGNTVILETNNKEYIVLAHFKAKSIVVEEGQHVKQGDLLGLCGNSGNSSEPHLHLSLQNIPDEGLATGAKLYFENILVNGKIKEDYLPVKNEKIQNVKL